METAVLLILAPYLIACGVAIFVGLDLRKWSTWLYGLYGFLSGFLIGFLSGNVPLGLQVGGIFAFIIIYGGATTRWHRQRFKK